MQRSIKAIKRIIIHCSDSEFGDYKLIDQWHKARGWKGCGYHYVITNGVIDSGKPYNPALDGIVQPGRMLSEIGAHCKGHNEDSIGVCLIGRRHFTGKQLYESLPDLIIMLGDIGITWQDVYGHCEFDSGKTCPNIDPRIIRIMMIRRRS